MFVALHFFAGTDAGHRADGSSRDGLLLDTAREPAAALDRDPMRILHCIPSMEGGGAERQLAYLAQEFGDRGHDVHVALARGGVNMKRLERTRATIHWLGPCWNHDPRLLRRLQRTIGEVKPDLVQSWLPQMGIVGGIASLLSRTPWVFCERSSADAYGPSIKRYLTTRIASFATAVVSNSQGGDDYWQAVGSGVPRYIVPNALPLDEIDGVVAATSAETGFSQDQPLILYAGRLVDSKNVDLLINALGDAFSRTPGRLVCCGEGPEHAALERLILARGLAGRVHIAGYNSNLWGMMKRATVLISLSRFEGLPNVVLEAMACRCPLVLSDIPSHRELVDARSAILVNQQNDSAVAEAIVSIIQQPEAAAERARLARLRAESHALPRIATQYTEVYREVLVRHAAPNAVAP